MIRECCILKIDDMHPKIKHKHPRAVLYSLFARWGEALAMALVRGTMHHTRAMRATIMDYIVIECSKYGFKVAQYATNTEDRTSAKYVFVVRAVEETAANPIAFCRPLVWWDLPGRLNCMVILHL